MKIARILLALSLVGLAACEQVVLIGPVGNATIVVTELRTGNLANSGTTGTLEEAIELIEGRGQVWDDIAESAKLHKQGKINFDSPKDFDDDTWYVITATGGLDYDADGDQVGDQGSPVIGSLHAIVKGSKLNEGQVTITPLTESAWQFVVEHVDLMTDAEIQQTLDQLATELLDADVDALEPIVINYNDVLTMNTLYFGTSNLADAKVAGLNELAEGVADGDDNTTLRDLARGLFSANAPDGIPEKIYENSISQSVVLDNGCGPGCHYSGGIGFNGSDNKLVNTTDPDYVAKNTENFRNLVENEGIQHILNKVQGIGHGGGVRIRSTDPEFDDFEDWLKLL